MQLGGEGSTELAGSGSEAFKLLGVTIVDSHRSFLSPKLEYVFCTITIGTLAMEDSPAANPKEYMRRWFPDSSNLLVEPRSHDLIPRADTAAFTFDLPELEAQFDNDPGAFSEWCQFPGDQMDFSSQVTTKHRTDHLQILDQPPHDKNASGSHVQQHEPRMILPNFGAASAEMLSPNQNTLLVDEPWNGCSYVFDVPQASAVNSSY